MDKIIELYDFIDRILLKRSENIKFDSFRVLKDSINLEGYYNNGYIDFTIVFYSMDQFEIIGNGIDPYIDEIKAFIVELKKYNRENQFDYYDKPF